MSTMNDPCHEDGGLECGISLKTSKYSRVKHMQMCKKATTEIGAPSHPNPLHRLPFQRVCFEGESGESFSLYQEGDLVPPLGVALTNLRFLSILNYEYDVLKAIAYIAISPRVRYLCPKIQVPTWNNDFLLQLLFTWLP